MSGILDLLNSDMGKTLISGASKQLGQDQNSTASALASALPLMIGAMKNNASTESGAAGLLSALNNDKHDGSILDNIGSIVGGSNIDDNVMSDGAGILKHLFGGKEQNVAAAVSKSNGMDAGSAMNLLKVAAPFIMGFLGKQTRQQNISSSNGIADMLGGLLGGDGGQQQQSIVTSLLDADGDGSAIDDIASMLLNSGGNKSQGGIGGLLGNLFG